MKSGPPQETANSFQATVPRPPDGWPEPLAEEALHGLAGAIVRTIEPHTEADPAALLGQVLAAGGSILGRRCYFEVEGSRHYPNAFLAIVGDTAKGRKGTSWAHTERLAGSADPAWQSSCVASGLSTGEGLIWSVRDPIVELVQDDEKVVDQGVSDKRLLVIETELARTLKVIERDGNTLSPVLRAAWDTGRLRILTKTSPARATDAHVSIVGHITVEELRRRLTETEVAAGLANRFLWLCVRRSKLLPDGGAMYTEDVASLVRQLAEAADRQSDGRLTWDRQARELWHAVYPQLSAGRPGLYGAVTARAEAQVVRLALIYKLLDARPDGTQGTHLRPTIAEPHLRAALAFWRYCDASALFIFRDSLGDPVADEILRALRGAGAAGLRRAEIRELFSRNRSAAEIGRALDLLERLGLAYREVEKDTGGRPAERWFAAASSSNGTRYTRKEGDTAFTAFTASRVRATPSPPMDEVEYSAPPSRSLGGRHAGAADLVASLAAAGVEVGEIASYTGLTVDQVRELLAPAAHVGEGEA
jgi:hypothetical protein